MKVLFYVLSIWAILWQPGLTLDNGLALTPPMGFMTWQRFRCVTDCKKYPDECISEKLVTHTADLMVSEGYLDAGYEYLIIDDCWLEKNRSEDGRMVPHKERFPNGMKYIADYIHDKGLKFGMYQDFGTQTCAGYPGVLGYEDIDIQTFVEWEIDYLKLDGCYVNVTQMDEGYPDFGNRLNKTGRPILYSCSWPAYQEEKRVNVDYASIAKHCNIWRNYDDIEDAWSSVEDIKNWFGNHQDRIQQHAGPGHFNDPDMLLIGNFGLTEEQAKVQMAVWSVLAAPLLLSADLASIKPEFKRILLNKDIIAVDQDPLGIQGTRVFNGTEKGPKRKYEIWNRKLSDGFALVFVSRRVDGVPYAVNFTLQEMGLEKKTYVLKDLYHEDSDRILNSEEDLEIKIPPLGCKFYKYTEKQDDAENE